MFSLEGLPMSEPAPTVYDPPFSSVQLLSSVWLFSTPWTAALQASLSITSSQSLLKLMYIELALPYNRLILYRAFLLLAIIFPSIRVFSNKSALYIKAAVTICSDFWTQEKNKISHCFPIYLPWSEGTGLKLNIQETKIMASGPITSWHRCGNSGNRDRLYFWGAPKSLQIVTAAMNLKDAYSLEEKLWPA